ncbi:MAG: sigma-70 family RNA polymerase sigma factor [Kofleriaceae bacterium]|nr:sigma-70 family RNA polymerase sigma factor [Kofleriaceae bacterium]
MKTTSALTLDHAARRLDARRQVAPRRATRLRALARRKPATAAATDARPARARDKQSKTDGSGYLGMYFRDMSALHVLQPEEEFTQAREIEALEIAVWQAVLGFAPALPAVLEVVAAMAPASPELRALRKLALAGERGATPRRGRAIDKAAARLREVDADRLFVDAALGVIDRIERGSRPLPRAVRQSRACGEWLRRVEVAARAAHDARNAFVKANLRLVISIARRFNHGRMSLADLIQEGNLGLMKAVERYDYRRGFRFSTYASWWIRHAISRALADKGREIRLPVHMIDAHHRLTKARRELTSRLQRPPTVEELAVATKMPAEKVENMRRWVLEQSVSLDRPVGDEDGRNLAEVLEDPDREELSPTADLELVALTDEVKQLLRELRPIEADILRQRFGLETEQELTLKEIGEKYNLSRERIRQLQEQALTKMRRALQRKDMM